VKTCTWSPPISRASAAHSGTVAKTLSAADGRHGGNGKQDEY
jgi:hypothetical protein